MKTEDSDRKHLSRESGDSEEGAPQDRVTEERREREARFRNLADTAPVMLWVTEPDGSCSFLSRGWYQFTGQSEQEGLGQDGFGWLDAVHPEDRERTTRMFSDANEKRLPFTFDYRLRRHDGEYRWAIDAGHLRFGSKGEFLGYIGSVLDITERKRCEEAILRRSEEQFRAVFNQTTGGIAQTDLTGRFTLVNDRYCDIVGRSREELLNLRMYDITHPEDLSANAEQFRALVQGGPNFVVEKRYLRQDGSIVWVYNDVASVRDSLGRVLGVVAAVTDITERKEAEQSLAEQQRLLKSVTDNASVALLIIDERQHCVFMNPAAETLTGFTMNQVRGRHLHKFIHHTRPDGRPYPLEECPIERAFLNDNRMQGEEIFIHPDGRFYAVAFTASPIPGSDGQPTGTIIEMRDITERNALQERLRSFAVELEAQVEDRTRDLVQSQDRLRALASELNLAEQRERKRLAIELHDHLQQILVLGKIKLGQGKRLLAEMAPAAAKLMKETDDVLAEALQYTRTLVSDLSPTVLRDHGLAAALQWLGTNMQRYEQTVTVTVPENWELTLPEDQVVVLFQSVRELLINSAKHAGTAEASLTMEQREGNLCITVQDEGKGFDLALATDGTPHGGISSKFGLFSIHERMRALGGSFDLQSLSGQGTTATLVLPLVGNGEMNGKGKVAGPTKTPASTLQPSASRIRVLLVDDHVMVRQGLQAILDAYATIELVGEAANGEEALQLVDRRRPTVVVMDINMPKMNGIEVTRLIKRRYPETIVVGLSVNAAKANEEAMKRAGAVGLMTKESAVEQLYDVIVEAVRKRGCGEGVEAMDSGQDAWRMPCEV
ncbi:MAG: PAS domain S-box protein [Nitrospira sp.]|nr:PAS domain S-box protein [Nitrospira sp.]